MASFPEKPVRGQSIAGFFENRIGLVFVHEGALPVGRANPITKDGYCLTAWHVVEGKDFSRAVTTVLKPLPRESGPIKAEDYLRTESYPGRVVWHDAAGDVALVHFPCADAEAFPLRGGEVREKEAVFSGASGFDSGVGYLRSGGHLDQMRGNGDYATGGFVLQANAVGKCRAYQSTLVGRKGMSGGAVVDAEGRLVGVVTRVDAGIFGTTTVFSLPRKDLLERVIADDRASRR